MVSREHSHIARKTQLIWIYYTGYHEAAALTRRRRVETLFSTLSRTSSTASLLDVKVEDPPENVDPSLSAQAEQMTSGHTSARLLFGRPPFKTLLRRSTRAAIRESISHRLVSTLKRDKLVVNMQELRQGKRKSSTLSELPEFTRQSLVRNKS